LIVINKVRKYLAVEDDVIRIVVRQSRRNDPDCTDDEIAEFAEASAAKIARQRNVDNPAAGLLISQTPKFFPGSELQAYRVRKAREAMESKGVARKVLDDPESAQDAVSGPRPFWRRTARVKVKADGLPMDSALLRLNNDFRNRRKPFGE
jgi:hypothetical protein